MTTVASSLAVTEPGVYDLADHLYHADPVPGGSLSSTGARRLLPPSCPAIFDWYRRNPEASKKSYDLGHAAHDTLLGGGPEIVVVDAENWLTKTAKAQRDEARARGAVPILTDEKTEIDAMVAAVRAHPFAGRLFEEGTGTAEASLFWTDEETGVWRRSRLDWLPDNHAGSRMILPDLKTCKSAQRDEFAKSAANLGYHQQGAYYTDAVRAGNIAEAKKQYAPSRFRWESIEPIAALVPDINGAVDARVDDFASVNDPHASWICAKSDEFTIRVLPRPIDLPVPGHAPAVVALPRDRGPGRPAARGVAARG